MSNFFSEPSVMQRENVFVSIQKLVMYFSWRGFPFHQFYSSRWFVDSVRPTLLIHRSAFVSCTNGNICYWSNISSVCVSVRFSEFRGMTPGCILGYSVWAEQQNAGSFLWQWVGGCRHRKPVSWESARWYLVISSLNLNKQTVSNNYPFRSLDYAWQWSKCCLYY